jgi:hypothetical protein
MELASKYAMPVVYKEVPLKVPELPAFVLHKMLVIPRRGNPAKQEKDSATVRSLSRLIAERDDLRERTAQIFAELPKSWLRSVLGVGEELGVGLT